MNHDDLTDGPMDNDQLMAIVGSALQDGLGADQDDLVGEREEAMDYYFGRRPTKPGLQGRSTAISTDVADTVEALLAQIMPTFASDTTATFEARGEEDERQAQMESDTCNYFIMEKCSGYKQFYEAIKDALLLKNGVMKIWVDEREELEITEHPPIDDEIIAVMAAQAQGEVYIEQLPDATIIKEVRQKRDLRIEAVPMNDFVIDASQKDQDLSRAKFVAQKCILTQTELIEMGIAPEIVAELPAYNIDTQVDNLSRNQTDMEEQYDYYEPSMKPVEVWECYMRIDFDGDGLAELRKILYNTNAILSNEIAPWIPYASGTPFINPHRWIGISVYDKLKEVADQKTIFLRQYQDNMVHQNNRRLSVVESQTNMTDAINSRPGGIVRVKSQGAVQEIPVSDIGPSCITALNYLDKIRTERTGASLDMQSEGLPTGNDTAHGVERQMSFKEQLAGMITKTLAETMVKQVYLLTHKTLRRYFPGAIQLNRNGQWAETDPSQWGNREHVSIDVGMSMGERLRKAASLQTVLETQTALIQNGFGGILCDASKIFNTVMDFCRMSGLDNPIQYWIDPTSPQAQQTAMQQMQSAQRQAQGQQQTQDRIINLEQYKVQSEAQANIRDFELAVAKQLADNEDRQDDNLREWTKLEQEHQVDIEGKGVE